jgi:hypothetical protein
MLIEALIQGLFFYAYGMVQFQLNGEIVETLKSQSIAIKSQQAEKSESTKHA